MLSIARRASRSGVFSVFRRSSRWRVTSANCAAAAGSAAVGQIPSTRFVFRHRSGASMESRAETALPFAMFTPSALRICSSDNARIKSFCRRASFVAVILMYRVVRDFVISTGVRPGFEKSAAVSSRTIVALCCEASAVERSAVVATSTRNRTGKPNPEPMPPNSS